MIDDDTKNTDFQISNLPKKILNNNNESNILNIEEDIEKQKDNSNNINENLLNYFNFPLIKYYGFQLIRKNTEFQAITFIFLIWIILTSFEFIFAFFLRNSIIISDAFFNTFKTISFLITCLSILYSHIFSSKNYFLHQRIELIAALSNIIFLVIVSLYMLLESLHLITESHEHFDSDDDSENIFFLQWVHIIKIIVDLISLLFFSDYILHPEIQIKLLLFKYCKEWKNLDQINYDQLKYICKKIKKWNNHVENMNSLCICLLSDLISSLLFVMFFYFFKHHYYNKFYMIISLINFIFILFSIKPLFYSIMKILMQGKNEIYNAFYFKLNKELSYYEGCLGVKEIKFWMIAQNEMKCYIKLYVKNNFDKTKILNYINNLAKEIELNCEFSLQTDE